MKTTKMFWTAVAAMVAVHAYAQQGSGERPYFSDIVTIQKADFAQLEKRYAACLSSDNDGVVESALAHIAILKLMYPVKDLNVLTKAVNAVASKNPSAEIRYKAYLVRTLLSNPKQFASEARTDYASPDEVFGALAGKIHDVIVGNVTK